MLWKKAILKLFDNVAESQEGTVQILFQLLESKAWLGVDTNKAKDDACLINYTYVFITIKVLMRFCFEKNKSNDNIKQKLLIYIKV